MPFSMKDPDGTDYPQIVDFVDLSQVSVLMEYDIPKPRFAFAIMENGYAAVPDFVRPLMEFQEPKPDFAMKIDVNGFVMNGYPYTLDYVMPAEPPEVSNAIISSNSGYIHKPKDETVTFIGLSNLINNDFCVVQLLNSAQVVIHEVRIPLIGHVDTSISATIDSVVFSANIPGMYTVKAFIFRVEGTDESMYCIYTFAYSLLREPLPRVRKIMLNMNGHYMEYHDDLRVDISELINMEIGDTITIALKDSAASLYVFEHTLPVDCLQSYSHVIPAEELAGLGANNYTVEAMVGRKTHRDRVKTSYLVVKPPEVSFVDLIPNEIEVPAPVPMIAAQWKITGYGIDSISGMARIVNTSKTANIFKYS